MTFDVPQTTTLLQTSEGVAAFQMRIMDFGSKLYRDLPWRATTDPYEIWISEVMLQQTQVVRVNTRWVQWLSRFPTLSSLAHAHKAAVLDEWQGLGYNRRALSLWQAAQAIDTVGVFPIELQDLVALPGIGPATAAGIRAFAYNLHGVYLETNVRSVFLHELFATHDQVSDKTLVPLIEQSCPADADPTPLVSNELTPRNWYYALLDYGAYLKQLHPNPSRRSKTYAKQSKFEGSHRQKRAEIVRLLLMFQKDRHAALFSELHNLLNISEHKAGRPDVSSEEIECILDELSREGFCHESNGAWQI